MCSSDLTRASRSASEWMRGIKAMPEPFNAMRSIMRLGPPTRAPSRLEPELAWIGTPFRVAPPPAVDRNSSSVAGGNGHDWDLAAADLLVHEAGGMVTALDGQVLIYNRPDPVHSVLIAAGRGRHAALAKLIRAQTSEPV